MTTFKHLLILKDIKSFNGKAKKVASHRAKVEQSDDQQWILHAA